MTSGTWKRLITFIITFDLAFSPLLAFAHEKKGPEDQGPDSEKITDVSDAQKLLAPILEMAAKLEAGKTIEFTPEEIDLWALGDQVVELFDGTKEPSEEQTPTGTYRLDQASLKRERPAFTAMKAKIDPAGHLVIEATHGENDKGEHGMLVARMHLRRVRNVTALAQDAEILSIVDSAGRLSVLDWGWVAATAFTAPVQVVKSVWQPVMPMDFKPGDVQASYITRGTRTLDTSNLYGEDVTFAADADGKPMHTPGDLVIKVKGKIFALLNRKNSHEAIRLHAAILYSLRQWIEDDPKGMEQLAENLKRADQSIEGFAELLKKVEARAVDPLFARTLTAIGSDVLAPLHKRVQDHGEYLKRETGSMSAADHDAFFRDVEANALAENKAEDAYMEKNWPDLVTRAYQTREQQDSVINEPKSKQTVRNLKYIAKMSSIAAGLVALMASPQLYEHSEFLQRFTWFSWTYQHAIPAVLKDAAYRWPLIYHTIAMTAIWPASPMISGLIGGGFTMLKGALQTARGPVSGRVRDFAARWSDMPAWKRIVAVGLRAYSFTIVTPIITVVEKMMQQRTLLKAASIGINPAEVITPESEIGQKVGLEQATTVGFNKMSLRGLISFMTLGLVPESKAARVRARNSHETKMRLIAEVYQRNKDRHNYTKILATLVVAEKYGIPASVLQNAIVKQNFDLSDLRLLVENPDARQMRELLDDELKKRIVEMPVVMRDKRFQFDTEAYAKQFEAARAAGDRITGLKNWQVYVRELRTASRAKSLQLWNYILNQGRQPSETLYNIMPNKEAYENTQREFILDHLMVVFMPALMGDRANFAIPDQLAADPNGILWTRGVALQDVAANTSAHFFTAGARFVLQHMLVKAVAEKLYEPIDKVINRVLYRDDEGHKQESLPGVNLTDGKPPFDAYLKQQKFWPGVWQFVKSLNPAESDIGGEALKGVQNNFNLIFGYFWFGMTFRLALGHQGFQGSAIGLAEQWLLAPMFIWVWWWVLQKGFVMYSRFFGAKQDRFNSARSDLAQARRERDPAKREAMQKDGIWRLYVMYDEGAPGEIDAIYHPLTTQASLDEQASYWADLASRVSPGPMTANRWVPWLASGTAAVGSTYTAIPVLVWSTSPDMQNLATLGLAGLAWAVFVPVFTWAFSKDTWTADWRVKFKDAKAAARGLRDLRFKPLAPPTGSCQPDLATN